MMMLKPQRIRQSTLEISVHSCPPRFAPHFKQIFDPDIDTDRLLIVPTFRKSKADLVGIGGHIEEEKDQLLEEFAEEAKQVCGRIQEQGFWADYVDPASGLPALGERHAGIYPEVLGAQTFLKYDILNAGCCQILNHPVFGTKVYPATMFTTAPLQVLLDVLSAVYPELDISSTQPSSSQTAPST
eukprot:m.143797 g.143797  ORF g.143797 m.143797 type:complete len:185 (+) comp16026_c0_seq5:150-704(+)